MTRWKRLFYYLIINALVSACVTLSVLTIWQRLHPGSMSVDPVSLLLPSRTPLPTFPPTDTPTPEPTEALMAYQVKAGDSLGLIAQQFGTTIDHLKRINGIDNPDSIGSGQVVFVPKPLETGTPQSGTASPQPGTPPAATPSPQAVFPQVSIAKVIGAGDLATERVQLECSGGGEISLRGWKLKDQRGEIFTFPELSLLSGGGVNIYTGAGTNTVESLYWGLGAPVWNSGDVAVLVDQDGIIRSTYTVP